MKVTLKQLADELGLSPATVSLALRNAPDIAAATRQRVCELAEARDYVQSNLGRALQSRRTSLAGCLIHGVTQTFYNEILQGAGEEASEHNYGLLTAWVRPDPEYLERQIKLMLEKDVDALIVADRRHLVEPYIGKFLRRGKPVVFCAAPAVEGCSEVRTDDVRGGFLAVELLAKNGHRHILGSSELDDRWRGNLAAANEAGVNLECFFGAPDAVGRIRRDASISAVAAYSDLQALDIMRGVRELGLRVPEDISIVGFDGLEIGERPEFRLTTVAQQRRELGAAAFRTVYELLDASDTTPHRTLLEPYLLERNTVGIH